MSMPMTTVTPSASVGIVRQWVGHLRFRNLRPTGPYRPAGPNVLPHARVDSDLRADPDTDGLHRIVLSLGIRASLGGEPAYEVDVAYGGLFRIDGVADREMVGVLLTTCPALLFPFARQVVSEAASRGGYPPLLFGPPAFDRNAVRLTHPPADLPVTGSARSPQVTLH